MKDDIERKEKSGKIWFVEGMKLFKKQPVLSSRVLGWDGVYIKSRERVWRCLSWVGYRNIKSEKGGNGIGSWSAFGAKALNSGIENETEHQQLVFLLPGIWNSFEGKLFEGR